MSKKTKILVSILSVILAILILLIASSLIDSLIYYFDNRTGRHLRNEDGSYIFISTCYDDEISFFARSYVARVKFVEMKRHFDKDKRAEYVFEVIEWINTESAESDPIDLEKKQLSFYSAAYPLKWKSETEIMLMLNDLSYKAGNEYILSVYSDNGTIEMPNYLFININKIENSYYGAGNPYSTLLERGITAEMSPDEIVAKIKDLIAEKKAKIEAQ